MKQNKVSAIDLFCGIGGLSYGLIDSGIPVKLGIDQDESCKYAFTVNNNAAFIAADINNIHGSDLDAYWDSHGYKVLVGCAPCQPFSSHSNKINKTSRSKDKKWNLINEFLRIIKESKPEIISMENVPNLIKKEIFKDFVSQLENIGYNVSYSNIYCPDYGLPQKRRRLVLLGSLLGDINIIDKTHNDKEYKTVKDVISKLEPLQAGESSKKDALHVACRLSDLNIRRIQSSIPNGSWLDWDEDLLLNCHKKSSGSTYKSVYGRMSWEEPSPTITTQFYSYGTGRFGHPQQDRGLTLREGALLQTFPDDYKFYKEKKDINFSKIGRHIGNAVPVDLGRIIGQSIIKHIENIGDGNG